MFNFLFKRDANFVGGQLLNVHRFNEQMVVSEFISSQAAAYWRNGRLTSKQKPVDIR
jgi:hypothetical protein